MKTWSRRLLGIGLVALALLPGPGPVVAPAQAASTITVDDNNAPCRKATAHTIQEAISLAGAGNTKIVVCAGTYLGPFIIYGKTNLKILAKKGVTLIDPSVSPDTPLVTINSSTDITLQGFTIDGLGTRAPGPMPAIWVNESSGAILKNKIVRWYSPTYPLQRHAHGIDVSGSSGQGVRIERNTIPTVDLVGIQIQGQVVATVSRNKISSPADQTGMDDTGVSGIRFVNASAGTITKNKLSGETAIPVHGDFTGITIRASNNVLVTGNTVTHASTGVRIDTFLVGCNDITVKGNKLLEVWSGIALSVGASGAPGDVHADNLTITGNKVVNKLGPGDRGINLSVSGANPPPPYGKALNALVKGNTITWFATPLYHTPINAGGEITGTFEPNKIR